MFTVRLTHTKTLKLTLRILLCKFASNIPNIFAMIVNNCTPSLSRRDRLWPADQHAKFHSPLTAENAHIFGNICTGCNFPCIEMVRCFWKLCIALKKLETKRCFDEMIRQLFIQLVISKLFVSQLVSQLVRKLAS